MRVRSVPKDPSLRRAARLSGNAVDHTAVVNVSLSQFRSTEALDRKVYCLLPTRSRSSFGTKPSRCSSCSSCIRTDWMDVMAPTLTKLSDAQLRASFHPFFSTSSQKISYADTIAKMSDDADNDLLASIASSRKPTGLLNTFLLLKHAAAVKQGLKHCIVTPTISMRLIPGSNGSIDKRRPSGVRTRSLSCCDLMAPNLTRRCIAKETASFGGGSRARPKNVSTF
jgi:hypothetical protein